MIDQNRLAEESQDEVVPGFIYKVYQILEVTIKANLEYREQRNNRLEPQARRLHHQEHAETREGDPATVFQTQQVPVLRQTAQHV